MKYFSKFVTALMLCVAFSSQATPINIVSPAAPGGTLHSLAMAYSEYLTQNGFENYVTAHPGALGEIGLREATRLRDNVVYMFPWAWTALSPVVNEKPETYSKDLEFVLAPVMNAPMGFLSSNKNFKTFDELVTYSKSNPLPCGVIAPHGFLELQQLNKVYHTQFEPIYYKSNAAVRLDLVNGALKCGYDSLASHISLHKDGKLNILSSAVKIDGVNVPLTSSVFKDFIKSNNWFGISIPKRSNLLENDRLMTVTRAFMKSKKLEEMGKQPGFVLDTPNPNIGSIMVQQTEYYRGFYSSSKK